MLSDDLLLAVDQGIWGAVADMLDPPSDTWVPQPHQIPPDGQWFTWMMLGGRGAGKTATAARWMHEHVHGPPCLPDHPMGHWPSIIAPTLGDGVTSCVTGPSGLIVHDPGVRIRAVPGGLMVRWSNGVEAKMFGAHTPEDVERLRSGGNRCAAWCEEMAAWRHLEDVWNHIRFGLRMGPNPQAMISTTPKNRALIKRIIRLSITEPEKYKVTYSTTHDNPHLNADRKKELIDDYGNTRLGQQEIYARILDDNPNSLWTDSMIEEDRYNDLDMPRHFDYVYVGVDPQGRKGKAKTGIIVFGVVRAYDSQGRAHGFVLADYSVDGRPEEWGRQVKRAFDDYSANVVVAEINNGGDMVTSNMRQVDPSLPVVEVSASRGKAIRAEPVSTLYEQHRIHHCGYFPDLEEQMVGFDPIDPDTKDSPDRMDALVWAATKAMVSASVLKAASQNDQRLSGRR